MRGRWMTALALMLGIGCSSPREQVPSAVLCSEMEWFESPKLKVLCTTAQVGGLVAAVAGRDAAVLVLIQGDLDPHSYQLVKGDDEKLERAELVFASGLGLEHGPSLQQFLLTQDKVVRLGDTLLARESSKLIRVDGQIDPHIWLDVSLWRQTIPTIRDRLVKALPDKEMAIRERAQGLEDKLAKVDADLLTLFGQVPQDRRFLVTSHDAFQYFTRRYLATEPEKSSGAWRERLCAPEGLAPEGQLGLADIQRVLKFCEQHHVHVLFPESNVNVSPLKKVVESGRQKGLALRVSREPLFGDTMGEDGMCQMEDAYEKMMRHNAAVMTGEWMEGR